MNPGPADRQLGIDRFPGIEENHRVPLNYDDDVIKLIADRCSEIESGARVVDAILTNTVLPQISRELLSRLSEGNPLQSVAIGAKDDDFVYDFG